MKEGQASWWREMVVGCGTEKKAGGWCGAGAVEICSGCAVIRGREKEVK